eukprot:IDg14306t1
MPTYDAKLSRYAPMALIALGWTSSVHHDEVSNRFDAFEEPHWENSKCRLSEGISAAVLEGVSSSKV